MSRLEYLRTEFKRAFGAAPEHIVRAPGRVNLIGEHTDYNQGFVLPMAIDRDLLIAARARADERSRWIALDQDHQRDEFLLRGIERHPRYRWANYIRGVAHFLEQQGHSLKGLDAALTGEIPVGAGLSSSAALEVGTATTFKALSHLALDNVQVARLSQRAENEFVGVKSGIMDQFASALGRAGETLLIDCRDLSFQYVPLPRRVVVIVADTMTRRALASSEYNKRRAECEEAVQRLSSLLGRPLDSLRDVSLAEFQSVAADLPPIPRQRARHVMTENERVLRVVEAARQGDVETFGRLMIESHESLRNDYQVSSAELDTMVEVARQQPGCFGARLTGAGFGGSTVNLVAEDCAETFVANLAQQYGARTGVSPVVMIVRASEGASVIE